MSWTHLEKLWEHTINPKGSEKNENWNEQMQALYSLGIGMEETLQFLYKEKPDLSTFKTWIEKRSAVEAEIPEAEEDVLTEKDLAFWKENGYVVIKNAVSQTDCDDTQQAIWQFLEMDPTDKTTWYKSHEQLKGLMLVFTDHPCLNRNRQSAKIKKAFEQLYQSTHIYKSVDKVSFNPPETTNFSFMGSDLHWDISLKQPTPFVLQGLLYLTDCGESEGAFHCVPGFHSCIGDWLSQLTPGENARAVAPLSLKPVPVPGKAGDFVIWHQALPHCATPNRGAYPRMVQYLRYLPVDYKEDPEWI